MKVGDLYTPKVAKEFRALRQQLDAEGLAEIAFTTELSFLHTINIAYELHPTGWRNEGSRKRLVNTAWASIIETALVEKYREKTGQVGYTVAVAGKPLELLRKFVVKAKLLSAAQRATATALVRLGGNPRQAIDIASKETP